MLNKYLFGYLLLAAVFLSIDADSKEITSFCSMKLGPVPESPENVLPFKNLSESELDEIADKRACVKGYANQFPGGEDAMLKASPTDLKKNLEIFKAAFRGDTNAYSKTQFGTPDSKRWLLVKKWDREQALLWGTFFLVHQAYRAGDLDMVLTETKRARAEFGLSIVKLQSWDRLEKGTYFSPQVLRNMIVGLEYMARISQSDLTAKQKLGIANDYAKDREAILPLSKFIFNPDSVVLKFACPAQSHTSE